MVVNFENSQKERTDSITKFESKVNFYRDLVRRAPSSIDIRIEHSAKMNDFYHTALNREKDPVDAIDYLFWHLLNHSGWEHITNPDNMPLDTKDGEIEKLLEQLISEVDEKKNADFSEL